MGEKTNIMKASNDSKTLHISDTTFRDGHQSLLATRLEFDDMERLAPQMDEMGFYSMEVWGGATFDATTRFLNEDPWERLRKFKTLMPKTPLSMLLRGQALVGYRAYADDVVKEFVSRSALNGIDIFRVFDALNDKSNLIQASESIKSEKKHLQLTLCYSTTDTNGLKGPIYNLKYYMDKAKEFEQLGADSICIKDMAGLLSPYDAFELVSQLKKQTDIPLQLHTHYSSGLASMTALKAVEAGLDILDTCLSPLALRTSQPATETMITAINSGSRNVPINIDDILDITDQLEMILEKYQHLMKTTKSSVIDPKVLSHQIPGGMASNLISQLSESDSLDKLDDVLKEIPETRKDLGYPPLVTPMSQMIGSQSVSNVLFGRYKMISQQIKDYMMGKYGIPTSKINWDLITKNQDSAKSISKDSIIKGRPADLLEPELPEATSKINYIAKDNIEDILIYTLYPTTGEKFLKIKYGLENPNSNQNILESKFSKNSSEQKNVSQGKSSSAKSFNVFVNDKFFKVDVDPLDNSIVSINEKISYSTEISKNDVQDNAQDKQTEGTLKAPMPGILINYLVNVGDKVQEGDTIAILEAMKMENQLPSPTAGIVNELMCDSGSTLAKGDVIAIISPETTK